MKGMKERVMRLDEMPLDVRRLVLALIDAHRSHCQIKEGCPTCHGRPAKPKERE